MLSLNVVERLVDFGEFVDLGSHWGENQYSSFWVAQRGAPLDSSSSLWLHIMFRSDTTPSTSCLITSKDSFSLT
jgi:hypothetical protein